MKVYVSELPKGKDIRCEIDSMVLAIDMSDKDKSYLMIGDKEQDNNFRVEFCSDNEVLVNCVAKIIEHLADYTKQVRKEVLSELMNMLGDRAELIDFGNGCAEFMFTTYDLQECSKVILDQIQGE